MNGRVGAFAGSISVADLQGAFAGERLEHIRQHALTNGCWQQALAVAEDAQLRGVEPGAAVVLEHALPHRVELSGGQFGLEDVLDRAPRVVPKVAVARCVFPQAPKAQRFAARVDRLNTVIGDQIGKVALDCTALRVGVGIIGVVRAHLLQESAGVGAVIVPAVAGDQGFELGEAVDAGFVGEHDGKAAGEMSSEYDMV